jgi:hypothetical protein
MEDEKEKPEQEQPVEDLSLKVEELNRKLKELEANGER